MLAAALIYDTMTQRRAGARRRRRMHMGVAGVFHPPHPHAFLLGAPGSTRRRRAAHLMNWRMHAPAA